MHQNYFRSNTEENHYRHLALFINCKMAHKLTL